MQGNPYVSVRLTPILIARLDALAAALSTEHVEATRSDALRATIEMGLPPLEQAHGVKPARAADPMKPAQGADNGRLARGGGQGKVRK